MSYIDYYKILGIDSKASQQEIRRAYREKAKKFHPDLNREDPDAQKHFQAINEANEVLSDPEKRKRYDEYGENWKYAEEYEAERKRRSKNGRYDEYDFDSFNRGGFSNFFEELFGGTFNRSRREKAGRELDLYSTLTLSLRDIASTHKRVK